MPGVKEIVPVLCSAVILAACGAAENPVPEPDPQTEEAGLVRSSLKRNTSPGVASQELAKLVEGNSALAFSLYDQFRAHSEGNFFYSPLSISQALAMAWAGARGQTEAEMASTLHFELGQAQLHPAMNQLDLLLASRGIGAQGADGKGFRLRINNALWGQRGYPILNPFLDVLAQNYDAGVRVLDFKEQPDASRDIINSWVEKQTEGKIKNLIESLDPMTRLVLTNTIYFNAAWNKVFPKESTQDRPFHRLDGSTVMAPAMTVTDSFPYADGRTWKAVELPYDGKELSMLVVVPEPGQFAAVEARLCSSGIGEVVGALQPAGATLTMPKWKVESKWKMKDVLKQMGMVEAFSQAKANFTGINGGIEPLWIAEVIHQSFISVDEQGTEAAAATAVVMEGGAMPPAPLVIDRPFIYLIRDVATGSILFAGRVMDPTA
jgi:serpin B